MIFEWDEAKSQWTLKERGFDFDHAARVFEDDRRLERIDHRHDYRKNAARQSAMWKERPISSFSPSETMLFE
jgi:uncharacterized DUF497 family protein